MAKLERRHLADDPLPHRCRHHRRQEGAARRQDSRRALRARRIAGDRDRRPHAGAAALDRRPEPHRRRDDRRQARIRAAARSAARSDHLPADRGRLPARFPDRGDLRFRRRRDRRRAAGRQRSGRRDGHRDPHARDQGPAGKLPERLEIDVSALEVSDHVTAAQVALPAGFSLITPAETIVVGVEGSRTAAEDAALTAAAPAPAAATDAAAAPPAE